jgi:hypothetical protein
MDVFDFLIDDDFDLIIEDGDFKTGESTKQHQEILLLSNKGEVKQFPVIGVGLNSFLLEDAEPEELRHSIQEEFENDGMQIGKLVIDSLIEMQVDAIYIQTGSER